ncbi:MAG: nuclear transport factor 2 family protein [Akkermansiaceae bacterium]|nr:nuclear transport factor 2 family protein [Akkermansiaceae bacterium]
MISFLTHPVTTFFGGAILALVGIGFLLSTKMEGNKTAQFVKDYRVAMAKAGESGPPTNSSAEAAAVQRFADFLKNVGDRTYLEDQTANVYAKGAYLDDTIATHYGPNEIQSYFLQTAETMTSFEVEILDSARSGADHYICWEMIFAAPKLASGEPIHSVGISQVRFNENGKVVFHQDFWDSGRHIFGQIPVVGGMIGIIKDRMK